MITAVISSSLIPGHVFFTGSAGSDSNAIGMTGIVIVFARCNDDKAYEV